jgi:hypothetical protein
MLLRKCPVRPLFNALFGGAFLVLTVEHLDCHHEFHADLRTLSVRMRATRKGFAPVPRNNLLYLVIGAFAVVVVVMGYQLYQDRHQPQGLNINVGPGGLSIQGK